MNAKLAVSTLVGSILCFCIASDGRAQNRFGGGFNNGTSNSRSRSSSIQSGHSSRFNSSPRGSTQSVRAGRRLSDTREESSGGRFRIRRSRGLIKLIIAGIVALFAGGGVAAKYALGKSKKSQMPDKYSQDQHNLNQQWKQQQQQGTQGHPYLQNQHPYLPSQNTQSYQDQERPPVQ